MKMLRGENWIFNIVYDYYVSTMDNYAIQLYFNGVGSKPTEDVVNTVRINMKEVMKNVCENITWVRYADDRCEGRIVTHSGIDLRPDSIITQTTCNPIWFKLHSTSKLITPSEIRVLRDAIYKEFKELLGFDFDILIVLIDWRLPEVVY